MFYLQLLSTRNQSANVSFVQYPLLGHFHMFERIEQPLHYIIHNSFKDIEGVLEKLLVSTLALKKTKRTLLLQFERPK